MAKKPKALGNDPFARGAAVRPVAGEAPPEAAVPEPAAAAAGDTTPASEIEAPAPGSEVADERAAASAPAQGSEAAGAPEIEAPPPGSEAPRVPEREAPQPKSAGRRTRTRTRTAGGAPRRRPAATDFAEVAGDAGLQPADLAAPHGRGPRRTEREEDLADLAGDAGLHPSDLAAAPREPRARRRTPEAGGLLPADLAAAPREPAVIAVPPVPPAHPRAAPPAHEPLREAYRPADAASAALVALRQLVGLPGGSPSLDVDELGYDRNFAEQVRPLLDWVYDRWFRVEMHGADRLPQSGPVILVANRAGALPWDSLMLSVACRRHGREIRPLVEDDVFHFPALGVLVNRLGAVRACPENAERLLGQGAAVAVFPEGATGFGKPFRERYRLQRFGRGGFAKLALRTGARIVPVSIVGSEEIHPLLGRVPAEPLGVPFVPITPTFPWLGLAGLLPLPAKWHIDVGDPIDLPAQGPEAARDDPLVLRLGDHVRSTIQAMLDERLAQRRSIFRG